ncbi:hypothetical protein [Gemmata sp.]|uniref:hypothetical protein n=1 Tax=Gemmata sp. TaxID=1914242 RepID=UPI003F72C48F
MIHVARIAPFISFVVISAVAHHPLRADLTPDTAPLIEAARTVGDVIPKGSVRWRLGIAQAPSGERTLGVELMNTWSEPIPDVSLKTVWEAHTPRPAVGMPGNVGGLETGGYESFFLRMTPAGGESLPPNFPVRFAYECTQFAILQGRAAMMSPEHHWIALCTNGHEFDRIPGGEIAAHLDAADTK